MISNGLVGITSLDQYVYSPAIKGGHLIYIFVIYKSYFCMICFFCSQHKRSGMSTSGNLSLTRIAVDRYNFDYLKCYSAASGIVLSIKQGRILLM